MYAFAFARWKHLLSNANCLYGQNSSICSSTVQVFFWQFQFRNIYVISSYKSQLALFIQWFLCIPGSTESTYENTRNQTEFGLRFSMCIFKMHVSACEYLIYIYCVFPSNAVGILRCVCYYSLLLKKKNFYRYFISFSFFFHLYCCRAFSSGVVFVFICVCVCVSLYW